MTKLHQPRARHSSTQGFTSLALSLAVAAVLTGGLRNSARAHDGDVIFPQVFPVGSTGLLPDFETNPTVDGVVGPLLPMHTMSVHNTLVWKRGKQKPGMLMFHRHSAYRADEVANPDVIHFLIDNPSPTSGLNAFASASNQFNSSMRRSFQQLCYGGYNIIHDVSQSVPTRIRVDQTRELTQLWDMNHPDAFKYNFGAPIHSAALLDNSDAEVNLAAFKNMGVSKGLYYDMYCPGFGTLEDGRAVFAGGHDMNSQNGIYRIQIFDGDLEAWAPRPVSCMRDLFGSDPNDPFFENFYQAEIQRLAAEGLPATDIEKLYLPDCDPHVLLPTTPEFPHYSTTPGYEKIRLMGAEGTVTQPGRLPSDMRYARWYPGQIALPGNRLLIYSGWDRDEANYPAWPTNQAGVRLNPDSSTTALAPFISAKAADPALYPDLPVTGHLSGTMKSGEGGNFLNSRVKQPVPEVYDGTRDKMVALENARLFTGAWYPNSVLVQTGPKRDDWKVGMNDGLLLEDIPVGTDGSRVTNSSVADRAFHNLWLLDVQGALKDPAVNTPQEGAGKWLTGPFNAANSHTSFTGSSNVMKINKLGQVVSHVLTHFGGQIASPGTGTSDQIEQIRFEGLSAVVKRGQPAPPPPAWVVSTAKLYQPGRQNYATPLPDGTTVLLGGNGGNLGSIKNAEEIAAGRPPFPTWENHSLHLQHFIPGDSDSPLAMPGMDMCNRLAKSLIPRDEHGIIQLMPDGTVYLGGQNRNGMVRLGDPAAPLGDSDLGVPCGQIFTPYLFDPQTGQPAERPVIVTSPSTIAYGRPFAMKTYTKKGIKAVTLIRTGSMSHSLNTDVRYVKVEFKAGKLVNDMVSLTVYPPKMPATAVGGYYYLFILDNAGVPSIAKVTVVGTEIDKRIAALKKAKKLPAKYPLQAAIP